MANSHFSCTGALADDDKHSTRSAIDSVGNRWRRVT
jgi:hypothetical protein